ncbi:transposase [Bacillus cereus]|uniref:transposase n=1 Tax=Bacillus cereus TaxID=1396 RepID=UPI001145C25E
MGKIRVTYDIKFKKKAVDLYLKEGMGYKMVTKELGINHSVIRHWMKHFEAEEAKTIYANGWSFTIGCFFFKTKVHKK